MRVASVSVILGLFSSLVRSWREAWSLSMRTIRLYLLVRISAMRLRSQMFSAPSSKWVAVHCAPVCAPVCPAVSIIIKSN